MGMIAILVASIVASTASVEAQTLDESKVNSADAKAKWDFNWGYSGISTFGHVSHKKCLLDPELDFDIGIIGVPFDTAVSYRPGARFGPRAIRAASNRHLPSRGFSPYSGINPYMSWANIVDCGDVPVTPFDNHLALRQMTEALKELSGPRAVQQHAKIPKLLILGGDHSVALPALRAMVHAHGQPVSVVHFDDHLDTLHPSSYPSVWSSRQSEFTHGSMFWKAANEGLILNHSSIHAGLRTRITGNDWADYLLDDEQGYMRLLTEDIDEIGPQGVIDAIIARVGETNPVYLSIDIDVLDPSIAPGTGAPEPGGWTMREMNKIIRGLDRLNIVGADIVEVAPAFDDRGEGTASAAAQLAYEIITIWVKRGPEKVAEANTACSETGMKEEL